MAQANGKLTFPAREQMEVQESPFYWCSVTGRCHDAETHLEVDCVVDDNKRYAISPLGYAMEHLVKPMVAEGKIMPDSYHWTQMEECIERANATRERVENNTQSRLTLPRLNIVMLLSEAMEEYVNGSMTQDVPCPEEEMQLRKSEFLQYAVRLFNHKMS